MVHIGCGDGALTTAPRADAGWLADRKRKQLIALDATTGPGRRSLSTMAGALLCLEAK